MLTLILPKKLREGIAWCWAAQHLVGKNRAASTQLGQAGPALLQSFKPLGELAMGCDSHSPLWSVHCLQLVFVILLLGLFALPL